MISSTTNELDINTLIVHFFSDLLKSYCGLQEGLIFKRGGGVRSFDCKLSYNNPAIIDYYHYT